MTSNEEYIRKNKIVTVDDDSNTRLHYAAALGNVEVAHEEIAKGQRLDPPNYLGWTPLMMAVKYEHTEIIDLLLDNRADATKSNKFGFSVFLVSVTSGNLEIVTKILNHLLCGGISRQSLQATISPLSLAIMFGHSQIFKYLLRRSFDVDAATALTGLTPMMFAAAISHPRAIRRLLHCKANPKLKNYLGKTSTDITHVRKVTGTGIDMADFVKTPSPGAIMDAPEVPYILFNHCSNMPYMVPYGVSTESSKQRKSSDFISPAVFCPPNVSPITPQPVQQMFFPPNFTPNQYPVYASNDYLNQNIMPSTFISPQSVCYPNYVQ